MVNNFSFIFFKDFKLQFKILIQVFLNFKFKIAKIEYRIYQFWAFQFEYRQRKTRKTGFFCPFLFISMANNFSFISFADFEYQFKILIQVFSNFKFKIAEIQHRSYQFWALQFEYRQRKTRRNRVFLSIFVHFSGK